MLENTQLSERIESALEKIQGKLELCMRVTPLWNFSPDRDEIEMRKRLSDELFNIAVIAQDASKAILESQDQDNGATQAQNPIAALPRAARQDPHSEEGLVPLR